MFFTFLSVCTTTDLLKIPLTLDAEKSFTIPSGVTSIDETFKVDPSQDADFQKYLDKIKGYEIDSISIASDSWTGPSNTTFSGNITLSDIGIVTTYNNLNLSNGTYVPFSLSNSNLISVASILSSQGLMNVNFKGTLSNNSGGSIKFKIKVYLKTKVV